jgi:filamentous hemagglutinin
VTATSSDVAGSVVNAGGQLNIVATGSGADSDIRISGSDVYGGAGVNLYADDAIDVVAAQDTYDQHTENSSSGWNVGVAASYGSGGGAIGITAGGNVGKGHGEGQTVTTVNAHVGSGGTTTLTSGGTTTIRGGQVSGDRVEVEAANLAIESLQDTQTYDSEQMNASAQVTVGYGASVSASYNQSKIKSDYASVTEQSGILAGDGGYAVNVEGDTELKGGIITSTQAAEDAGENRFATGTLVASDIANHAAYEGSAFGISGSAGKNGDGKQGEYAMAQGSSDGRPGGMRANKSFGLGSDGDSQQSTTSSGINTKNITLTDTAGQAATGKTVDQIKADVATTTSTDAVAESSGALGNRFDADAVQKELDVQVQVTQGFDQNRQEAKAELYARAQAKADKAREIRMANDGMDTEESKALDKEATSLRKAGSYVDMAATAVFAGPELDDILGGLALTGTNRVYRTASRETKIVLQKCEANGQNCVAREVDLDDVRLGEDGKVHIFNNGIFNEEAYALATGAKQNTNEVNAQGAYYILNPYTGNFLDELLYAGYDKANDLLGGMLPLTSAEKMDQAMIDKVGELRGVLDSVNHSRGGLTWTNATQDLKNKGAKGLSIGGVLYNGAAANAQEEANLLQDISKAGKMYQSTHPTDVVGRWIGRNPATGEKNEGFFPPSHSSYTGYEPAVGTIIQVGDDPKKRVDLRNVTDANWGKGKHSTPVYVPPNKPKASATKSEGK